MIASVGPILAGLAGTVLPSIIDLFRPSPGGASLKKDRPLIDRIEKGFKTFEHIRADPLVNGVSHIGQDLFEKIKSKSRNISAPSRHPQESAAKLLGAINLPGSVTNMLFPKEDLVGVHPNPGPKTAKKSKGKKQKAKGGRGPSTAMTISGRSNVAQFGRDMRYGSGLNPMPVAVSQIGRKSLMIFPTGMADSVRIQLHMYCADITSNGSGNLSFTSTATSLPSAQIFPVHPLWVAAPISTIASNVFLRYRFTRLTLHYIPVISTQQSGLVALGFTPDGNCVATSSITTTRVAVNSLSDSIQTAVWLPADIPVNLGDDGGCQSYYTYVTGTGSSSSNAAANRLVFQGGIVLASDNSVQAASSTQGSLWMTAELILFGLGNPAVLGLLPPAEQAEIAALHHQNDLKIDKESLSDEINRLRSIILSSHMTDGNRSSIK
jgi:hypothetical protein